jgi:hypothetical protein
VPANTKPLEYMYRCHSSHCWISNKKMSTNYCCSNHQFLKRDTFYLQVVTLVQTSTRYTKPMKQVCFEDCILHCSQKKHPSVWILIGFICCPLAIPLHTVCQGMWYSAFAEDAQIQHTWKD